VDTEWIKNIVGVIATHGPWAVFCFYITYKHFQLQSRTIEVMTAVKTLIETLECRGGNKL
jgi:hypothetical protein